MTTLKIDDAPAEPRATFAARQPTSLHADRGATTLRRERDNVSKVRLTSAESLKLSREMRALALMPSLPDSTQQIRADRDAG